MTTENSKKLNPNTIRILQSEDTLLVKGAIEELRENGNAGYLPVLIELLHTTSDDGIKKSIINLLSELKHHEAIPLLIGAIQDKQYANELSFIVSACWENGLDYSEYLSVFVDLVLGKDFRVAFEAYTVITNMTGKIPNAVLEAESRKIKETLRNTDNEIELLQDLLDFLPELSEGIEPKY
jgi:hypothetical protein